jgi:cytochrome c553
MRIVRAAAAAAPALAALAAVVVVVVGCALALAAPLRGAIPTFSKPQSNYLLGCGGCHGENGLSNSRLVPELHDEVGYFLNTTAGREYLVRLPNVAFSTLSDRDLADVLNFTVFRLGGVSVPAGARPYTEAEVGRLRQRPLNEVSLIAYRKQLIDALITRHQGSERLRLYGGDSY